jgi:protein-L-isoaspartate(D-aspartate) O-methyltransferase
MLDFAKARQAMVDGQVRVNDVTDPRVVRALLSVPREVFVPAGQKAMAYLDSDMPLDIEGSTPGRMALKPMVFGKMLQAVGGGPESLALVIGAGLGYGAAVMAQIAAAVVAVESDAALAASMRKRLAGADIANVEVVEGDMTAGASTHAPFDVILVEGAVDAVPQALFDQLRDGGVLVAVVGRGRSGRATVYRRTGPEISGWPVFDAAAPLLPGFARPPAFVF